MITIRRIDAVRRANARLTQGANGNGRSTDVHPLARTAGIVRGPHTGLCVLARFVYTPDKPLVKSRTNAV